jgi:hypothetical protein
MLMGTVTPVGEMHRKVTTIGDESTAHTGWFGQMLLVCANRIGDGLMCSRGEEVADARQPPHRRGLGPLQDPRTGLRKIAARHKEGPERNEAKPRAGRGETRSIRHTPRIRIIHGVNGWVGEPKNGKRDSERKQEGVIRDAQRGKRRTTDSHDVAFSRANLSRSKRRCVIRTEVHKAMRAWAGKT